MSTDSLLFNRYTHRALVCGLVLCVVTMLLFLLFTTVGIDDAYAEWGAADMVIAYLEENNGKWPSDYASLRAKFDAGGGRVGGWTFDDFQRRIFIDFNVDPIALQQNSVNSETITFNVIHAKSWMAARIGGGPNSELHQYWRRKAGVHQVNIVSPFPIARPMKTTDAVDE